MIKIRSSGDAVKKVMDVFNTVSRYSLKKYLKLYSEIPKTKLDEEIDAYIERSIGGEATFAACPVVQANALEDISLASMNAFDAYLGLIEDMELSPIADGITVCRGRFPYDYVYVTSEAMFLFINYGPVGKKQIAAHNLINEEGDMKKVLVIIASDGYAEEDLESLTVNGDALIVRIKRGKSSVTRKVTVPKKS